MQINGRHQCIVHRLSDAGRNVHKKWSNDIDPVLTVNPGDVVRIECRDALNGQIDVQSTGDDIPNVDFDKVLPMTGPIAVDKAEPGDVLEVNIHELQHKGWGYTAIFPGHYDKGVLSDTFEDPELFIWDLMEDRAEFVNGIEIPLDPFPGTIGVAPGEPGPHSHRPPRDVGGNMDIKHLTSGATLYLPVETEYALFSIGDCHAAQGDGEVCVTGIEAPMFVTVSFDVLKNKTLGQPQFESSHPYTASGEDEPMHATTGIDSNLMTASRKAVSHMVGYLVDAHDLSNEEAYILSSVVVDLKINEIVDEPNWVVSAYLPLSIFPE